MVFLDTSCTVSFLPKLGLPFLLACFTEKRVNSHIWTLMWVGNTKRNNLDLKPNKDRF